MKREIEFELKHEIASQVQDNVKEIGDALCKKGESWDSDLLEEAEKHGVSRLPGDMGTKTVNIIFKVLKKNEYKVDWCGANRHRVVGTSEEVKIEQPSQEFEIPAEKTYLQIIRDNINEIGDILCMQEIVLRKNIPQATHLLSGIKNIEVLENMESLEKDASGLILSELRRAGYSIERLSLQKYKFWRDVDAPAKESFEDVMGLMGLEDQIKIYIDEVYKILSPRKAIHMATMVSTVKKLGMRFPEGMTVRQKAEVVLKGMHTGKNLYIANPLGNDCYEFYQL